MNQPEQTAIGLKRAYDEPSPDDGKRLLVERLWPRGVRREAARIDHWFKDLAPSPDLRRWYDHDVEKWPEFRQRYVDELNAADPEAMEQLLDLCVDGAVTFVFAAKDTEHNSAVVLRHYILKRISPRA